MSQFQESLTTKIGPLPAWAWGLALGAGINGFRWYRNRTPDLAAAQAAAAAEVAAADFAADDQAVVTVGRTAVAAAGVYSASGYESPADGYFATPAPTGPGDNDSWRAAAIERLVGRLGYSGAAVQGAIDAYFNGDPLTESQEAAISEAIRAIGATPSPVPPITRKPATTAPAPNLPPAGPSLQPNEGPKPFVVPSYNGVKGATKADPLGWAWIRQRTDFPNETDEQVWNRAVVYRKSLGQPE